MVEMDWPILSWSAILDALDNSIAGTDPWNTVPATHCYSTPRPTAHVLGRSSADGCRENQYLDDVPSGGLFLQALFSTEIAHILSIEGVHPILGE